MDHLWQIQYSYLIPLLPLAGAVIAGFFGARWLKHQSHWPIWIGVGLSAIISITLLFSTLGLWGHQSDEPVPQQQSVLHAGAQRSAAPGRSPSESSLSASKDFYSWIRAGDFEAKAGFFFDPLTVVMLCVVTGIGFFITVFSAGYMKGEAGYFRFFAYLGLFIFAMTILVMGNNLVMLYLGWEGVGLCSYLLIGYYYEKPAAREAAKKAFIVNRIGDFAFGIGIMLCYLAFKTISFYGAGVHTNTGLLELAQDTNLTDFQHTALHWIPFLLMIGAFGKSAQFPLYVWLPDAMEGPTPVSALIHAATMVTAGVYMIVRCGPLFVGNAAAMNVIAVIGCITALLGATIALRQFDLKKVFAYSTVSQLGFMFVGVGCLAPVAGVFHLVTHAFFKALLFLSCGVVMHAMAGELDMRKMSGLKRVLPRTRWLMLIGCLALAGFPFFAGFFSKDEIVAAAWAKNKFLGLVMLFTAFLTAYYTFRLYFEVFEGLEIIPSPPTGGHGHDTVDEQLVQDPHHGQAAKEAAHGTPEVTLGVHDVTHEPVDDARDHDARGHGAHDHGADAHGAHSGHHNQEPAVMIIPLVVLAIGAIFAGYLNFPERARSLGAFLGNSPSIAESFDTAVRAHHGEVDPAPFGQIELAEHQELGILAQSHSLHLTMMIISGIIAILGVYLAYVLHLKRRQDAERMAAEFGPLTRLLEAKYYIDEIYQACIIEPLRTFGRFLFGVDRYGIDGLVSTVSFIPQALGFVLKIFTQRGYLQGYAVTMLLGIAVILFFVFW